FVYSAAGDGAVHAHSNTFFDWTYPNYGPTGQFGVQATASATLVMPDFVISGAPGTITTRLFLHLTGLLQAGSSTLYSTSRDDGGPAQTFASSSIGVTIEVNGTPVGSGTQTVSTTSGSVPTLSGLGLLKNFDGDDI